jgi:AraC-like DNA-binding protein
LNNDWQTDQVFPFTINRFEFEKKTVPGDSGFHILYLDQGKIFYKKTRGFTIFHKMGFIVIPPLLGPGIRLDLSSRGYEITISRVLFEETTAKVRNKKLLFLPGNEVSFIAVKEQEGEIFIRIIENLLTEWKEKKTGFRDIIRLKLAELFINLTRIENSISAETGLPTPDNTAGFKNPNIGIDIHTGSKRIEDILSYLEKMYHHQLSLEDIANKTGFSTSYLSRYFKHETGMCLFEYINKLRIRQSCFLLKNTNKKIIEIAYEVGYNSISFFNRYFKKTLHISPLEYRKKSQR